jgi:hypothetical protein
MSRAPKGSPCEEAPRRVSRHALRWR